MITQSFCSKELNWFRNSGTSPLESHYAASLISSPIGSLLTVVPPIDTIIAVPFLSGRESTATKISFEITSVGGAGSKARVGIYNSTSLSNLYPSSLVVDGGEFDTSSVGGVGVKSTTISTKLSRNTLYWFVYLAGTSAPTLRGIGVGATWAIFGASSSLGSSLSNQISGAQTYGALPSTFPASLNPASLTAPLITVLL